MKKQMLLISLLVFATILVNTPCKASCCTQPKTLYLPRSQANNYARESTNFNLYQHEKILYDGDFYGICAQTLEYSRSFSPRDITDSLFGSIACGNTLSFSGSQVPNRGCNEILADYFGLPTDYKGTVHFCPRIQNIILDLGFHFGLDKWCKGLYFNLYAPFVHTRWSMNAKACTDDPGKNAFERGYMDLLEVPRSELPTTPLDFWSGCATWGDMKKPLSFSKVSCKTETKNRFADVHVTLGWDGCKSDLGHVGIYGRASFPTGNKPEGKYLFEPIVGNGGHFELGGGINMHAVILEKSHVDTPDKIATTAHNKVQQLSTRVAAEEAEVVAVQGQQSSTRAIQQETQVVAPKAAEILAQEESTEQLDTNLAVNANAISPARQRTPQGELPEGMSIQQNYGPIVFGDCLLHDGSVLSAIKDDGKSRRVASNPRRSKYAVQRQPRRKQSAYAQSRQEEDLLITDEELATLLDQPGEITDQFAMYVDFYISHQFKTLQARSLDLFDNAPGSRFILAVEMQDIPTNPNGFSQSGHILEDFEVEYAQNIIPTANISTFCCEVSAALQSELTVRFEYTHRDFSFSLGYNFWGRTKEKTKLMEPTPTEKYVLKGDSYMFGVAVPEATELDNDGAILDTGNVTTARLNYPTNAIALAAGQENSATLFSGENWKANHTATPQMNLGIDGSDQATARLGPPSDLLSWVVVTSPITGLPASPIYAGITDYISSTAEDYDLKSATIPSLMSHKLFANLNFGGGKRDTIFGTVKPYVGFGGEVEFGSRRKTTGVLRKCVCGKSLSQWGIWLKGGFAF